MRLDQLKGQPHAIRCLNAALRADRFGSAYLFYGPPGVGKRTAAFAFGQTLNCQEPGVDGEPCGTCLPCVEIEKGIYGELKFMVPEGEADREDAFHTEQISDAIRWAFLTAHVRRTKVCIMDEVHLMSYAGANHFLKTLEEPPPKTVWVLLTSDFHAVLPTIRSRCRLVRFNLLPRDVVAEILREHGKAAEDIASLCIGRVDEDPAELAESIATAKEIIDLASKFKLADLCAMGQVYGRKDKAQRLSAILDSLELVLGAQLRATPEESVRWVQALDAVGRARVRFRRYASRTLVDSLGAELAMVLGSRR